MTMVVMMVVNPMDDRKQPEPTNKPTTGLASDPLYMTAVGTIRGIFTSRYKSLGDDERAGFKGAVLDMIDDVTTSIT